MKDPENGEGMKGGAPEEEKSGEEEVEEKAGEEAAEENGEEAEKTADAEEIKEAAEEETAEEMETPGESGADKLSRPLIAGGIAVLALSWVAIIVLAVLLATSNGNPDTSGVDEVVQGYFQAYSEGRVGDAYKQYYSPEDLSAMAEQYGMSVDDFIAYIGESAASTPGLNFEGVEFDITYEDVAVATITAGTAVYVDEEGAQQSEDMSGVKIELANKDGKWYMKMPSQ